MWDRSWAPYVPVAKRRARALAHAQKLAKKGEALSPVRINGRDMAKTFWGKAWCGNLEMYSDFENRLPRGRTYARNGSIVDLKISSGEITALVSGSSLYRISIKIDTLANKRWQQVRRDCANSIHSLMDLLRGKFSESVMQRLTNPKTGLFPAPKEIKMKCSCPDSAGLCKHLAAVMYGVGNRLDSSPELLFLLRAVDHQELIEEALASQTLATALSVAGSTELDSSELGTMFGIELVDGPAVSSEHVTTNPSKAKRVIKSRTIATSQATKPAKSKKVSSIKETVPIESAKSTATAKRNSKPSVASARVAESTPSPSRRRRRARVGA